MDRRALAELRRDLEALLKAADALVEGREPPRLRYALWVWDGRRFLLVVGGRRGEDAQGGL